MATPSLPGRARAGFEEALLRGGVAEPSSIADRQATKGMELAERFSNPDFLVRIDRLLKGLADLS